MLENNYDGVVKALEIVDMTPDDAKITAEEYSAFAHGITPSGELEVAAWEGYYVTNPLPNGQAFALLIRSSDNTVYWGPVEGFAEKHWSQCKVDYHLGSNATLCFSSSAGDVTLTFSRNVDEETGDCSNNTVKVRLFYHPQHIVYLTVGNRVLLESLYSQELRQFHPFPLPGLPFSAMAMAMKAHSSTLWKGSKSS